MIDIECNFDAAIVLIVLSSKTSLKLTFRALITRIKALTHYSQLAHNAQLSSEYSM